MNIFQQILGTLFPPYKISVIRNEQYKLFQAIISSLPVDYKELQNHALSCRFWGFENWNDYPGFKFVTLSYPGETYHLNKQRGLNFKISGLRIFLKSTHKFEDIEILVKNNLVQGLKITNSDYRLKEFDLEQTEGEGALKSTFSFLPNETDVFYNSLSQDIKDILNPDDIFDIDFNNRIFYAFYDLEDGNYLAVDKNLNVYSLVHDERPMATRMKTSFSQILNDISEKHFVKEKHLEERYRNSK